MKSKIKLGFIFIYLLIFAVIIFQIQKTKNIEFSPISNNDTKQFIQSLNYTPSKVIPFWFWNDDLKKEELTRQIDLMHEKGITEIIIHARYGLDQKYLSEEWFNFVGHALQELKKRNMKAWIYDDFDWPSSRANGKVLELRPDLEAHALKINKSNYAVYEYTPKYRTEYSKQRYVDLLDPDTVKVFINLTYEEYYKKFSEYFGDTIVGFFTDEPGFYLGYHDDDFGAIAWTNSFPEYFYKYKGYNITEKLYCIWFYCQDSERIKIDYFDTRTKLYLNYFEALHNWTQQH